MRPREWYEDHENLAELYRWLEARCEAPAGDDIARFLEEPWKWTPEFNEMRAEQAVPA